MNASNDIVLRVTEKGTQKAGSSIGKLTKIVGGLATAYLGLRGAMAIKNFAVDSVKAYVEQNKALKNLQAVVGKNTKEFEDWATQVQKVTIYGDEMVLSSMQLAATMGIERDRLKEATQMAIGFGAAMKMDVTSAMRYVVLAMGGNYTMMSRYLPKLRELTTDTEKMAYVTKVAANGWKIAKEELNTQPWIRMTNAIGDLKEKVGKGMMPAITEMSKSLSEWAESGKAEDWARRVGSAFGTVLESITNIPGAIDKIKVAMGMMQPSQAGKAQLTRDTEAKLGGLKSRDAELAKERERLRRQYVTLKDKTTYGAFTADDIDAMNAAKTGILNIDKQRQRMRYQAQGIKYNYNAQAAGFTEQGKTEAPAKTVEKAVADKGAELVTKIVDKAAEKAVQSSASGMLFKTLFTTLGAIQTISDPIAKATKGINTSNASGVTPIKNAARGMFLNQPNAVLPIFAMLYKNIEDNATKEADWNSLADRMKTVLSDSWDGAAGVMETVISMIKENIEPRLTNIESKIN